MANNTSTREDGRNDVDPDGMQCPDCGSRDTHSTDSWTGHQQTTGPKVTVEKMMCRGCGKNWVY